MFGIQDIEHMCLVTMIDSICVLYSANLPFDRLSFGQTRTISLREKASIPFSMAIGNAEYMQQCSPEHLRMGTEK